jgi:hypothetical protein
MIVGSRNSSFFPDLKPTVQMSEADELSADMIDHFGGDPSPNLWSEQSGQTIKPNVFFLSNLLN